MAMAHPAAALWPLLCLVVLLLLARVTEAMPTASSGHGQSTAFVPLRPPSPRPVAAAGAAGAAGAAVRASAGIVGLWAKRDKKLKPSSRRRRDDSGSDGGEAGGGGGDEEGLDGPSAPRVSSQINIPVRRQIAFVKQMKKLMKTEDRPATPPPKKARKKKTGVQRAAIASDYPEFDPSLCTTFLLVDGYNVINAWSKMIKARSVGGMPTARAALLEQLRYISQARGGRWKVVVAYDEHTPGSELRVMEGDVDEVYTGELESADSYIERRAVELCARQNAPMVKVATDDRTIQVVSLAGGAEMMSTSSLIREIYLARRELLYQRDGGEGWASRKSFDDAMEYFD